MTKINNSSNKKCEICNNEIPKSHSKYCNRVCQHKAQLNRCLEVEMQ